MIRLKAYKLIKQNYIILTSSFDNKFFFDVLSEKKTNIIIIILFVLYWLPFGSIGGYIQPFYNKEKVTKNMIFKNFIGDDDLMRYILPTI